MSRGGHVTRLNGRSVSAPARAQRECWRSVSRHRRATRWARHAFGYLKPAHLRNPRSRRLNARSACRQRAAPPSNARARSQHGRSRRQNAPIRLLNAPVPVLNAPVPVLSARFLVRNRPARPEHGGVILQNRVARRLSRLSSVRNGVSSVINRAGSMRNEVWPLLNGASPPRTRAAALQNRGCTSPR